MEEYTKLIIWIFTVIVTRYIVKYYKKLCEENVSGACTKIIEQDWKFQLKIINYIDMFLPYVFVLLVVLYYI